MSLRLNRLLIFSLVFLAPLCLADDDSYQIQLDRPNKKGDKSPLEIVYAQVLSTKTTWQGSVPTTTEDASGAQFSCEAKTLEVDNRGRTRVAEFTIRKFVSVKEKDEKELLPPGTKLLARAKKLETEFLVDDKPVSPEVKALLGQFISMGRTPEMPNTDEIYGTGVRRKIGETWPLDAKVLGKYINATRLKADADSLSGEGVFKSLETFEGEPCIHFESDSRIKDFATIDPLPDGSELKLKHASATSHMTFLVPIDLTKEIPSVIAERTFEYTWTGQREGLSFEMIQTIQSETNLRIPKE